MIQYLTAGVTKAVCFIFMAIDWDSLEKQALAMPRSYRGKGKTIYKKVAIKSKDKTVPAPKYPPLPLHLSSQHLDDFINFRAKELGFHFGELLGCSDHLRTGIKQQLMVEAFMLGFPCNYIHEAFNQENAALYYAIKNYCGNNRIQEVRERYSVPVYS